MKKFLLSMAVMLGALTASADVTVNFAENKAKLPESESETATAATIDGVNFSFVNCKGGVYQQAAYLQISGKNYSGNAYMDMTLPEATKSIVITTGTNGSVKVTVQLSADGTNIGDAVLLDEKGKDFTFAIPEAYQAKGTVLRLATANKYNAQITKMVFSGEGGSTPEPGPDPEVVKVGSVAEIIALEEGVEFETTCTLQVGWVKYSNIFVCDPAGDFIQIYGSNTLQQGDVIPAGLKGSYKLFNGVTPEIENATIPAATAGTFVPRGGAATDVTTALVNNVITIKNVVLTEDSPAGKENFTASSDGVELSFRNNYTLESVAAGTYDITVVVTIYKGEPSLYVTKYELSSSTGIADINADDNAAVEYFNLQGVRIAQPEAGQIVIRRQGNKVSKVLVK